MPKKPRKYAGADMKTLKRISRATGQSMTDSLAGLKKLRKANKKTSRMKRKAKELGKSYTPPKKRGKYWSF